MEIGVRLPDRQLVLDMEGRPRTVGWERRVVPLDSNGNGNGGVILTTLTITSCPNTVEKGESFTVKGTLVVQDTGSPIEGGIISFWYNGTKIGSDLTDATGLFTGSVAVNEVGTFNVSANFVSTPQYGPSNDFVTVVVSGPAPPDPPVPGEGRGEILEVSLPDLLKKGSHIDGYVRVRNNGDEDTIRLLETRVWSGKQIQTDVTLGTNYVANVPISATMPDEDAKFVFNAQHLEDTGFITDHSDTHTITLEKTWPNLQWWHYLLIGGAALVILLLAFRGKSTVVVAKSD